MLTSWISAPVHMRTFSVGVCLNFFNIYTYISTVFPFHSYVKETFNVFFVQCSLFFYLSLRKRLDCETFVCLEQPAREYNDEITKKLNYLTALLFMWKRGEQMTTQRLNQLEFFDESSN